MYDIIDDELMDDPRISYIITSSEDFEINSQEDEKAYKQYLIDALKEAKE